MENSLFIVYLLKICVKNKDGSFETYYFANKTGLDFISSLLKKTGVEYITYQKIKKGE